MISPDSALDGYMDASHIRGHFQADGAKRSGRVADDYRSRIYRRYLSARASTLPQPIDDFKLRAAHLDKLIRLYFPHNRDAAILDLGCGPGALIYAAKAAGYRHIQGVDRSAQQIQVARTIGIESLQQGDLLEAISSVADLSLDAVVTIDVIEHLQKYELAGLVDEVLRVLQPGGRWIIHAPNGGSPFCSRVRYGDFTHELAFTRESLSQLLLSSGFGRVTCYEDGPAAHGVLSAARWLLWRGLRMLLRLWLAIETGESGGNCIFTQNLFAVAEK